MQTFLASSTAPPPGASAPTWLWIAFGVSVVFFLFLDLFVLHRGAHRIDLKEALWANALWVAIGLGFGLVVLWEMGSQPAGEYYAGYLLERALSIDNVFVFAVIFAYFKVPAKLQNGVLFWGLVMALFMRAGFIVLGGNRGNLFFAKLPYGAAQRLMFFGQNWHDRSVVSFPCNHNR